MNKGSHFLAVSSILSLPVSKIILSEKQMNYKEEVPALSWSFYYFIHRFRQSLLSTFLLWSEISVNTDLTATETIEGAQGLGCLALNVYYVPHITTAH